jgi:hypothetical protein
VPGAPGRSPMPPAVASAISRSKARCESILLNNPAPECGK